MLWLGCLYDDSSFAVSSAASSPELFQYLDSLFVCSEILHSEQCVSCDDCDKPEVAEVKAFGQHLRADEDVDVSFAEFPYYAGFIAVALGIVTVESRYPRMRK